MSWFRKIREELKTIVFMNGLQSMREERGAVFVLTALLLPVMLGFMGFAYDVGNLYMYKARLQNVADAASLAGARAFVEEAASKRKTYRNQYLNNNPNVTTIPSDVSADINLRVKADAKIAAKDEAVASVNQNMVNLGNNNYQSAYSLITGRITESGKDYEQQYFKAYLRETVPLYFIPILLNKKEQDVAAEAISTIINKGVVSKKKQKFGPDSLFMVKDAFSMEGTSFYNDGTGNTGTAPKKAPTWKDNYVEGNLRYTGNNATIDYGNVNNRYFGDVPFDRVFNKKALELMTALRKLEPESTRNDRTFYNNFLEELQKHPDFYADGDYTPKGKQLVEKLKDLLPESGIQYDIAFWGVYGAFYEELYSNPNYYRKFEKLENYNMDLFGDSIKAMFKSKLAAEKGISEETYRAQYQEAHDAWVTTTSEGGEWKTEHDNWQTNHNTWEAAETAAIAAAQAQIDEMVANGGGSGETVVFNPKSTTPQEVYNKIKQYTDLYKEWNKKTSTERAGEKYIAEDKTYFGIDNVDTFLNIANNIYFDDSWTSWNDVDGTDWRWGPLKQGYQNYLAGGGQDDLTPKAAYEKLLGYKAMQVWNYYETSLMAEVSNDNDLKSYNLEFWQIRDLPNTNDDLTWKQINDYSDGSPFNNLNQTTQYWWNQIKSKYQSAGGDIEVTSSTPTIPTVDQLMASWYADPANAEPQEPQKPREPLLSDFIPSTDGDEYYAQYNGSNGNWTASEISSVQNSKEHSYFYYAGSSSFTLTVDDAGFYTDDNITTETPFYLIIGDNYPSDVMHLTLEADVNRPLIFCYMGTKNPKIHIALNGHTFQGIIYTPNSYGGQVLMNVTGGGKTGTFKGTWMSGDINLKQSNNQFQYEEYYLDPSLQKAMPNYDPTQQEEYSGGDDITDEDLSDKNPIKVIKLVKKVENVLSEEPID